MFNACATPRFDKILKDFKRNKPLQEYVRDLTKSIIPKIPRIDWAELSGNCSGVFKHVFTFNKVQYRILYVLESCCTECELSKECEGMITYVFLGTREETKNIYNHPDRFF